MSTPHSVVFLGTSSFAVPCLKALTADDSFAVKLVVTQPDKPVGRKQELTPSAVKVAAMELGLPILQSEKLNAEVATLHKISPDFLVVVSFGQILSEEVLATAIVAAVNVHASLLPKLRGASPIQHAILEGMHTTGVTVQRMVKELDAGPILTQKEIMMGSRETYQTLHEKLAEIGAKLLISTIVLPLSEREQKNDEATFCHKLTKADGEADPATMTADHIDRMVRALTPWPSVTLKGLKLLETSLEAVPRSIPLPCTRGTVLHIRTIQPPGGKPMSGADFHRGHPTAFSSSCQQASSV